MTALDELLESIPRESRETILRVLNKAHLEPNDPFLVALIAIREHDQELKKLMEAHSLSVKKFSEKLLERAQASEDYTKESRKTVDRATQLLVDVQYATKKLASLKWKNIFILILLAFIAGILVGFFGPSILHHAQQNY